MFKIWLEIQEILANPQDYRLGSMQVDDVHMLANLVNSAKNGWNGKKVGLFSKSDFSNPQMKELYDIVLKYKPAILNFMSNLIIGEPVVANKLLKMLNNRKEIYGDFGNNPQYHKDLGRILGYSDAAITDYLGKIGLE
jgi:hypothetical protein